MADFSRLALHLSLAAGLAVLSADAWAEAPPAIECSDFPRPGDEKDLILSNSSDGAVWYAEVGKNRIVRIGRDRTVKHFAPNDPSTGTLNSVAVAKDGKVWYLKNDKGRVGWIPSAGGAGKELPAPGFGDIPEGYGSPRDLRAAPDGTLWFYDPMLGYVARIDATGAIKQFAAPADKTTGLPFMATGIAPAPDGSVWFSVLPHNAIYRLDPKTGAFKRFDIATANAMPRNIVADSDSSAWVILSYAPKAMHITPAGVMKIFDMGRGGVPTDLLADGKGGLWYTMDGDRELGFRTPNGTLVRTQCGTKPGALARGPDGEVWVADLGKMQVASSTQSALTGRVREVPADDFLKLLEANRGQVVVQFTSYDRNCIYCTYTNPRFDELAKQSSGGIQFWRVRWEPWSAYAKHPVASAAKIPGLPYHVRYEATRQMMTVTGDVQIPMLKELINAGMSPMPGAK